MAVLGVLDPVQSVQVDGYDFLALAAGRTPEGLMVSLQVANGVVCWADTIALAEAGPRHAAAEQMAGVTDLVAARADFALLQLVPKVEVATRAYGPPTDWPAPLPLREEAPPPFPIHCLPRFIADMAAGLAEALQVPVDMPCMLSLAVLGTALMKKFDVKVRQGYYVPVNCYVMVGMESGERKSPVYRAMTAPLVTYERELIDAAKEAAEANEAKLKEPAPFPQLFADDITTEQVPVLLEQNHERLGIFSDEGDTLDIMAGRYSKGTPNFGIYLKAWDGGAYKVNRGMRPSIYLAHPLLSIGLCVQESVLRGLAETPAFRDRGLLGRFWFSLPTSFMGTRKPIGTPVPDAVRTAYGEGMRWLFALALDPGTAVPLSHEAHELLVAFSAELEPRLAPDGDLRSIKDWVAKLEGSVVRLAGLLHMAETFRADTAIAPATMRRALLIGRYLLAHAGSVFGLMRANPHMEEARVILRWLIRHERVECSRRDIYRGNESHFAQPVLCLPGIEILVERGILAPRPPPPRGVGCPPTPVYDVNPLIFTESYANTQNSPVQERKEVSPDTHNSDNIQTSHDKITPLPAIIPPFAPSSEGYSPPAEEYYHDEDTF